MRGLFNRFVDFLIYSNLYIAIAAVLLTIVSQVQLGLEPGLQPYLFLILFATLFEYNLHKILAVFFYKKALNESKFGWISRNMKLFHVIVLTSVVGFIVSACFAKWSVLITLLPLGAITFLYSFPIYKKGNKIFRLREVPLVKIFIISFVWAATSILLPAVQADLDPDPGMISLLIFERFLFVFSITVPFDIRDMESDDKAGLKTLPLIVGERSATGIANIALVLFIVLSVIHYTCTNQFYFVAAFLISGISTIYFITSSGVKALKHYYYGILDGTMILQAILVFAFYFLFNRVILS
jgi:4-hydroxybenzoate polyprenyltransferase